MTYHYVRRIQVYIWAWFGPSEPILHSIYTLTFLPLTLVAEPEPEPEPLSSSGMLPKSFSSPPLRCFERALRSFNRWYRGVDLIAMAERLLWPARLTRRSLTERTLSHHEPRSCLDLIHLRVPFFFFTPSFFCFWVDFDYCFRWSLAMGCWELLFRVSLHLPCPAT